MSNIKFRAWHKALKLMCDIAIINLREFGYVVPIIPAELMHLHWDEEKWAFDQIELLQFTWLKDINGKEIYEGDILCFRWVFCNDHDKYIVKRQFNHINLMAMLYIPWTEEEKQTEDYYEDEVGETIACSEWEIIGNIYENPELLQTE